MAAKAKKMPTAIDGAAKDDIARGKAMTTLSSAVNAAAVIESYSKSVFGENQGDLEYVFKELSRSIEKVQDGDLTQCEAMLLAQATALQSVFTSLMRRAVAQEYLGHMDTYTRLGLKAQAQAVRTIEALNELKNPRSVAFVKQANIANGPQQVNNGTAEQYAHARETENQQNQLSGGTYELLPDARASQAESRIDTAMETLGEINRAKDRRG